MLTFRFHAAWMADKYMETQQPVGHINERSPHSNIFAGPNRTALLAPLVSILILALLITSAAWTKFFHQRELVKEKQKQLREVLPVSVVTATLGPKIEQFTLPGTTQAIQDAPIFARVNGYLGHRFVDIGDKVHAGQILADIETPERSEEH